MKAELCRILNKIGALKFGSFKRTNAAQVIIFSEPRTTLAHQNNENDIDKIQSIFFKQNGSF